MGGQEVQSGSSNRASGSRDGRMEVEAARHPKAAVAAVINAFSTIVLSSVFRVGQKRRQLDDGA